MCQLTDFLVIAALWEGLSSQFMQYCFLIGSNLQCLFILLCCRCIVAYCNHDGLSQFIRNICEYLTFNNLPNQELDIAVVKFLMGYIAAYFFSILLTIILLIFGYFRRDFKHKLKKLQRFMTYFGQFHLAFVFWPTTILFLTGLLDSPLQRLMVEILDVPYWLMIASGLGLSMISYIFGSFLALFSYDPFLSSNVLSCHTSSFQFLTFLFKAVLAPIIVLVDDMEYQSWLVASFSLVIMSIRHYKLLKDFCFYEYRTMKIAIGLSSVCLTTSFFNFISLLLKNQKSFNSENTFIEEIVISFVILRFWDCYFESTILNYLGKNNSELKTQENVIKKFFSLRHFMESVEKLPIRNRVFDSTDLRFWGLIKFYDEGSDIKSETDSNSEIYDTGIFDILSITQLRAYLLKTKNHAIHKLLDDFAKKLKNYNKLRLLLISRCLASQENIQICIIYLIALSKAKGIHRIIASKLSMNIQEHIDSQFSVKQENVLDVRTHLNFDRFSEKLAKLIYSNCQKQIDFWTSYEDSVLTIKDFYEKSKSIEKEHLQIKSFWENYIEPNKIFASYLVTLYSLYLSLIRHRPALATKTLKKYIALKLQKQPESNDKGTLVSEEILNDKNTLTFHTSMSKERLGIVLYTSPYITETVGWRTQELIGKNINTIIPLFIKEGHDQALESYLKQIESPQISTKFYKSFNTFLVDRNGYVLPCHVYISLHPDIQKELVYIAIVKVKKPKEDYIMFNNDGYISGFTNRISDKLDLTFEREMHIEEICKNYSQLQKLFANNRNIGARKGLSQRRLEKTARSFRLNSPSFDSGRLMSASDISTSFPKANLLSTRINLDLVNLRAQKKGDAPVFQYKVHLSQETVFNLNFYILKLNPILPEKNPERDFVCKNSASLKKSEEEDVPIIPDELQYGARLIGCNGNTLTTNNLLSMESESDRKRLLRFDSPKRLNIITKKVKNEILSNFNLNKYIEGAKSVIKDFEISKDEEGNNGNFENFLNTLNINFDDTNSDMSHEKRNLQIEKTIHRIQKDNRFRNLKMLVFLLVLVSFVFLSSFQLRNHKILGQLEGNIEILSQTTIMLTHIVQTNKLVRFMLLDDLGLLAQNRYDGSVLLVPVSGVRSFVSGLTLSYARESNTLNNNIKNSLYKIDADLQNKLLQTKVPVYQLNDSNNFVITRKSQLFELTSEIVSETITLINNPTSNFTCLNSSLYFIFNNTMNDYSIEGERITPTLMEDCKLNLESQSFLIRIFFSLLGLFCLYTFGRFLAIIRVFIKKRNIFINIFKRLGNDNLVNYMLQVKRFASLIEKNNFGTKGLESKLLKQSFYVENFVQEESKIQKKSVDLKFINTRLIRISVFVFFYLASFSICYLTALIRASQQTKIISTKIKLLTESNSYLYQLILFHYLQYEYIQENATTIMRNKPIHQEYKNLFESLTKAHDFYIVDLLNENNGLGTDDELIEIVKGNICAKLKKQSVTSITQCLVLKGGVLKSGIIGLNSLLLSIVETAISSFDNSPKSLTDMYGVLNSPDVVLEELIFVRYIDDVYSVLSNIIESHIKEDFDKFGQKFELLLIMNTIWGFLSVIFIWSQLSKALEQEITKWGQIIRQIPLEIVTQNKLFKGYWKGIDDDIWM